MIRLLDYWKKVLGDNVFNNIEKVYKFLDLKL